MKSRKTPDPSLYKSSLNAGLHSDPQVVKWVQRLTGDPKARPSQLDETRLEFVMREVLALRGEEVNESLFHKAMIETCPILAAPDWTDNGEDIAHVFRQPEMRAFWDTWQPKQSKHGPKIDFFAAKAVLCVLAMCGTTVYFDDAIEMLQKDRSLRGAFEQLEGKPLVIPPYSSLMKHVHRAAKSMRPLAMQTNINMVKELAALFPNQGFGEDLAIDGMPFSAWVPQRGSKNAVADLEIGRRIPEAGYRMYSHKSGGKVQLDEDDQVSGGDISKIKDWRGFYVVAIIDLASGLPLVWLVVSRAAVLGVLFLITISIGRNSIYAWPVTFLVLVVSALSLIYAVALKANVPPQTLVPLQVTLLRPWQIVVGKLGASFAFLALLVLATAPLLSIAYLIGGVTVGTVLKGLALVLFTGLTTTCLTLLVSGVFRRVQGATVAAYSLMLLLTLGSFLVWVGAGIVDRSRGDDPTNPPAFLLATNPLFAAADVLDEQDVADTGGGLSSPFQPLEEALLRSQYEDFGGGIQGFPIDDVGFRGVAVGGAAVDQDGGQIIGFDRFGRPILADDDRWPFWATSVITLYVLAVAGAMVAVWRLRSPAKVER